MTEMQQWIAGLGEEDLAAWANRGLLRRAHKILSDVHIQVQDDNIVAQVQQNESTYTITVADAGFTHIQCSCNSVGPCHHALAALMAAKAEQPQSQPETLSKTPWLIEDETERERLLGRRELRQATEKLHRGLPVKLLRKPNALVGVVTTDREFQVRIPASTGIADSLCD